MTDPFATDAEARALLASEVASVRVALFRAANGNDAQAALVALRKAFALLDRFPDGQIFCTGNHDQPAGGIIAPPKARAIRARFNGFCSQCDGPYAAGDVIWWSPVDRLPVCTRCGGVPAV